MRSAQLIDMNCDVYKDLLPVSGLGSECHSGDIIQSHCALESCNVSAVDKTG